MSQPFNENIDIRKKDQLKKKAVVPKKSSSVIICRKKQQPQSSFDYQFLMLRRNPKLPFGGMHSFPGGNMDKEDAFFTKARQGPISDSSQLVYDWQDTLIYTGIRELFEEIGVIIAKRGQEHLVTQLAQNENLKFEELYLATKPDLRTIAIPFLRIITIQQLARRWDAQFFIIQVEESGQNLNSESYCLLNILKYQKTKKIEDLYDTNDLVLGQDESDTFSWETPISALSLHAQKKIKLPIPQVLICNLMSSLESSESVKNYLHQIDQQHSKYSKLADKDYLRMNPSTFPIILDIQALEGKNMKLTMCGDEEYPFQKMLEGEEESEFKNELVKAFNSVKINPGQKIRIISDFLTDMQSIINCDFIAPFTLLRHIDLQNVTPLKVNKAKL